jgi:hypothetical protein
VIKMLIKGTGLSMLIFLSVSFLTGLKSILMPAFDYRISIGFPFRYYYQFWVDGYPQHGSDLMNGLYDCIITWVLVVGGYLLIKRKISTY